MQNKQTSCSWLSTWSRNFIHRRSISTSIFSKSQNLLISSIQLLSWVLKIFASACLLTHLTLVWTSSGHCMILYMITELSLLLPEVQEKLSFCTIEGIWGYVISIVFSKSRKKRLLSLLPMIIIHLTWPVCLILLKTGILLLFANEHWRLISHAYNYSFRYVASTE